MIKNKREKKVLRENPSTIPFSNAMRTPRKMFLHYIMRVEGLERSPLSLMEARCRPTTQEAETGRSLLRVLGQPFNSVLSISPTLGPPSLVTHPHVEVGSWTLEYWKRLVIWGQRKQVTLMSTDSLVGSEALIKPKWSLLGHYEA